jgi:hypothetical protein
MPSFIVCHNRPCDALKIAVDISPEPDQISLTCLRGLFKKLVSIRNCKDIGSLIRLRIIKNQIIRAVRLKRCLSIQKIFEKAGLNPI